MPYGRSKKSSARSTRRRVTRRSKYSNSISTSKGFQNSRKVTPTSKPFSDVVAGSSVRGGLLIQRSFLPQTMICAHRYTEQLELSAENVAGLTGNEVAFRMNSLFDPNFTLAGHQPFGYDQMGALYNRYTVYKVTIQVRIVEINTSNSPELIINVRPSASVYNLTNKKVWEELERPENVMITGTGELKQWNQTLYIADIEGVTRNKVYSEDSFSAISGNNPGRTPYLSVAVGSVTGSTPSTLTCIVCLEFHTIWSGPAAGLARS